MVKAASVEGHGQLTFWVKTLFLFYEEGEFVVEVMVPEHPIGKHFSFLQFKVTVGTKLKFTVSLFYHSPCQKKIYKITNSHLLIRFLKYCTSLDQID